MSEDGKDLTISWPNRKKSETKLLSADEVSCIYKHKLTEDTDSKSVITGCANEIRHGLK